MYDVSNQSWSLGITRRIRDHVIDNVSGLLFVLENNNTVFTNSADTRVWMDNGIAGDFSVKKYYNWLLRRSNIDEECNHVPANKIWSKLWPPKVSFFMWLASKQKVLTQDKLIKRKWRDWVNHCYLCINDAESSTHMLLHCSYASKVWNSFIQEFNIVWIISPSIDIALHCWPHTKIKTRKALVINSIPGAIIWNLWKERNQRAFDNNSLDNNKLIERIKFTIAYWLQKQPQFKGITLHYFMLKWNMVVFEPP